MAIKGYKRRACEECGKRFARNIYKNTYLDVFEIMGCCSQGCYDKHKKKLIAKEEKRRVKKEAQFITKVAKEVIRLQGIKDGTSS